jgi:hypothetical protein
MLKLTDFSEVCTASIISPMNAVHEMTAGYIAVGGPSKLTHRHDDGGNTSL